MDQANPTQQVATGSTFSGVPSTLDNQPPQDEYSTPIPANATDTPGGPAPGNALTSGPQGATPPQQTASGDEYNTPIPEGATDTPGQPTAKPGFWSRTGESSGVSGLVDLGKQAIQYGKDSASKYGPRPIDALTDAISDMRNGNWKDATEKADKLIRTVSGFDPDNPLIEAAKQIVKHSVNEAAAYARQQNEGSTTDKVISAVDPSGIMRSLKEGIAKAVTDSEDDNLPGAIGDMVTAPLTGHGIGTVPLIGGAVQQLGESANQDLHNHNYGALTGDIAGAIASVFAPKLIGKAGGALKAAALDTPIATAADTVRGLSREAASAPEARGLFDDIQKRATDAKASIDNTFADAKLEAQRKAELTIQAAKDKAEAAHTAAQDAFDASKNTLDIGEGGKVDQTADSDQLAGQHKQGIEDFITERQAAAEKARTDAHAEADIALEKETQASHEKLQAALEEAAAGAPDPGDLPGTINNAINEYEKGSHTTYEAGINGTNGIATTLKGQTLTIDGSNIQEAAKVALNTPDPKAHYLKQGLDQAAGDVLTSKVKEFLENVSNGAIEQAVKDVAKVGETAAPKGAKVAKPAPKPIADVTISDLIDARQSARKLASKFLRGDPNISALRTLIDGIDADIEAMANASGKPDVIQNYADLRKNYKEQRAQLDTKTADALKLTDADKAKDSIANYLTGSGNSAAKIENLRNLVGQDAMTAIAKTSIEQFKAMAETNPKAFSKAWETIAAKKPWLRDSFYGPDATKALDAANELYKSSITEAESQAKQMKSDANAASKTEQTSNTGLRRDLLANNTAFSAGRTAEITTNFNKAVQDLTEKMRDSKATATEEARATGRAASKQAGEEIDTATKAYREASRPYNSGLLQSIVDGNINQKLLDGKVGVSDVRNLKNLAGDNWKDLADGILHRAIQDSSTQVADGSYRFDPGKFMKWRQGMGPGVFEEMFPDATSAETVAKVQDAAKRQRWLATGAVGGTLLGAGGIGALFGSAAGHMGEMIGALTGAGSSAGFMRNLVHWAANHPEAWKAAAKVSRGASAVQNVAGKALSGAGAAARYAPLANQPSSKRSVYDSASKALGGAS